MTEKEIINKIIKETGNGELPQKPIENVLREMRKEKARSNGKTKRPFYRNKAFISACACMLLAVVIIPAGIFIQASSSKYMSEEPNPSVSSSTGDGVWKNSAEVSLSDFEKLRLENGVIFPDEIEGVTPTCCVYSNEDEPQAISISYDDLCYIYISCEPTKTFEDTDIYNNSEINGVNIYSNSTDSSETSIVVVLNGWFYDITYFGDEHSALQTIYQYK